MAARCILLLQPLLRKHLLAAPTCAVQAAACSRNCVGTTSSRGLSPQRSGLCQSYLVSLIFVGLAAG
jgi:hypothetical protein